MNNQVKKAAIVDSKAVLSQDDCKPRWYVGEAAHVLSEMPEASVDCVVTSPPYWGKREYESGRNSSRLHKEPSEYP